MNRANSISIGKLGSLLVCLCLWAATAQQAQAAADTDCSSCHDQGQKLAKSAHAALDLRHVPRKPREISASRRHPPSRPVPAAMRARQATTPAACMARRSRTATRAPRTAPSAMAVRTNCCSPSPRVPDRGPGNLRDVPRRSRGAVQEQRPRQGPGQRRDAGAALHRLPRRASILSHTNAASPVNAANIRETCGSCHGDVRLSRANSAFPPTGWSASTPRSMAWPPRPARRPWPTAPVAMACTTSCLPRTRTPPSTPRTCPPPADAATPAPDSASASARCTSPKPRPNPRRFVGCASSICC